jgi:hypothetical protein
MEPFQYLMFAFTRSIDGGEKQALSIIKKMLIIFQLDLVRLFPLYMDLMRLEKF